MAGAGAGGCGPTARACSTELLPRLRVALAAAGAVLDLAGLFPQPPSKFWLEIGFGSGEHLAEQARRHPEIGFIGCELFVNGVAALVGQVERLELANVRIFDDDARLLLAALPEASIDRAFLLFPDPWPKTRHDKRRFVGPANLATMARVLADGAEFRVATDDAGYVRWTLQQLDRPSGLSLEGDRSRGLARAAGRLGRDALSAQGAGGRTPAGIPLLSAPAAAREAQKILAVRRPRPILAPQSLVPSHDGTIKIRWANARLFC